MEPREEKETYTQTLFRNSEQNFSEKYIYKIIGEENIQNNSNSYQNAFDPEYNSFTESDSLFCCNKRNRCGGHIYEPETEEKKASTTFIYCKKGNNKKIETEQKIEKKANYVFETNKINDKGNNKVKIKVYLLDAYHKIKELGILMNKSWKEIFQIYKISFIYSNSMKLMKMTLSDFVENIYKHRKVIITSKNIEEAKMIEEGLREIFTKEKYKKIHIIDEFNYCNNINSDNLINPEEQSICIEINENDSKYFNIEINIVNRIDTIFKTLKSMINQRQLIEFNKISGNNKLPEKIPDYLDNITNKSLDLLFMENSFKDNLLHFMKESKEKDLIKEVINAVEKEKNEKAIKILEMKTFEFIKRIISYEKEKKEFLKEDEEREINFIKNKKCKILYLDLETKFHPSYLIKIEKYVKKGNKTILDAEEFRKEANKLPGYENFTLELTEREKEKIEERKLILENLAENPMIYLYLIEQRKTISRTKNTKK